ncbi:MAG: hypothetical protein DRN14_03600 [Thermoplasmata archaeon]|nr:MAG: hypothetical protein DRN14_03600 [Thermoplasmata archaeon]
MQEPLQVFWQLLMLVVLLPSVLQLFLHLLQSFPYTVKYLGILEMLQILLLSTHLIMVVIHILVSRLIIFLAHGLQMKRIFLLPQQWKLELPRMPIIIPVL